MLNGVDYSAPVGGGSGESTEQIREISERVKILEVKVPFGFSTTSVGAYGYLDLEGNFHEFGGAAPEPTPSYPGDAYVSLTSNGNGYNLKPLDDNVTVEGTYIRHGTQIGVNGSKISIQQKNVNGIDRYVTFGGSNSDQTLDFPFSLGIDADGNCGFKKPGADSVTPFKNGTEPLSIENKSSTVVEQTISPRVLQSSPYNNIKWMVGCIIPKNVNNIPPNVKWYKINSTNPTTGVNMITEEPTSEIVNIINKYFKDYASIKMGYTTFDGSVYSFYNFTAETYGNDGIPFIWLPDIKAIDMYFLQGYSVRLT